MSLYTQFGTDHDLETQGIDLIYDGYIITVARAGGANKKFTQLLDRKFKKHRRAGDTIDVANDVALKILGEIFAETVILNWRTEVNSEFKVGITNKEGGDLLPVTRENIILTFNNVPDLFDDIRFQTSKISMFRHEEQEKDAEN